MSNFLNALFKFTQILRFTNRAAQNRKLARRAALALAAFLPSVLAAERAEILAAPPKTPSKKANVINIAAKDLSLAKLKAAIAAAEKTASDDVVVQTTASAHTITYKSPSDEIKIAIDPEKHGKLTITASGPKPLTLDAARQCRVMSIALGTVKLEKLTITNGKTSENGGGIYADGSLRLIKCAVSNNEANSNDSKGGGIFATGTLEIASTVFTENSARGDAWDGGGAIWNDGGKATLIDVDFSKNKTHGDGGAIYTNGGVLSVSGGVFTENTSKFGGGAIFVYVGGAATVDGATFTNNTGSRGGGIFLENVPENMPASSLTLSRSQFSGNEGTEWGGGLAVGDRGTATITAVKFQNNKSEYGGGANFGLAATGTIVDSTFTNNTVTLLGGGMHQYVESNVKISNSTFIGNSAEREGGGARVSENATATIVGCEFRENVSKSSGGAFHIFGTATFDGVKITNNKGTTGGGIDFSGEAVGTLTATNVEISENQALRGGGLYINSGSASFANSVFKNNAALSETTENAYGGAIFNGHGTLTATNVTIAGNVAQASSAEARGGGIYCGDVYGVPSTTLIDSIVAFNASQNGGANDDISRDHGTLVGKRVISAFDNWNSAENTLVYDSNRSLFVVDPTFDENGNLTNAARVDLRLTKDSPAIDAGNKDDAPGETDLAGNPRVGGKNVDLGAYEYAP